jgi:N-acetylneuraminate synthase/sialic acid synthase
MVRACAAAGVQAVKLQKRENKRLYTQAAYDAPYQSENAFGATYGAHREALELSRDDYRAIMDVAAECRIACFATAFDPWSADFLAALDVPAFKIASGDLTNTPLIRHVSGFGKPVIISTGGGWPEMVRAAHDAARAAPSVAMLQCTAVYPTPWHELHLAVIPGLAQLCPGAVIGWSGHDNGIAMAVMAYALGARIIEKHMTLDRTMKGTDHAFSLEPAGLKKMCRDLGRAFQAWGSREKRALYSEGPAMRKMGKMLVAARDLPAGHVLQADDLAIKSPALPESVPPFRRGHWVGRVLPMALAADDPLLES